MTNLHEVNFGLNQYCGPAVLSAITGESTDRCAAVISAVSGKKVIKGVQASHLKEAFRRLRFDVININPVGVFSSRLHGLIMELSNSDGFYIIIVPGHFIAIEVLKGQVYLVDNASKSPLPANSSARLMQRVEHVFKVIPRDTPKFIQSIIQVNENVNSIDIYRVNIFENDEDNTRVLIGNIRYSNKIEYQEIIIALAGA